MIQCQAELIKRLDINIILTYDEKYLVALKYSWLILRN